MTLVFNKDILGILFDNLEDDTEFLLFVKQNNIKIKEGIKWETLNWCSICENNQLSVEFIDEFSEYLEWNAVLTHQTLSEELILKYGDELDWLLVSQCQTLSETFMAENSEDLDWHELCYHQDMSDEFIIGHQNDIHWVSLLDCCAMGNKTPLSENVLVQCFNQFDSDCFEYIFNDSECDLTEVFIKHYIINVNSEITDIDDLSYHICNNGNISEEFIEQNMECLNMDIILSEHPELSDKFIEEHTL